MWIQTVVKECKKGWQLGGQKQQSNKTFQDQEYACVLEYGE